MLATIFGWPKEATLEDRKLNARWLIDQSGVKDENMTMTFTDKKGRLSNYARLRFSNQGLRDRSSLPWSNSLRQSWHQRCKRRGWLFGTWRPDAPGDIKVWFKEKNKGNFEKKWCSTFSFFMVMVLYFLFLTSPITISVSSVQLVKLLVTGTQQMGWEDPAEWSNRVTNLGDEVKIQQRHELFSSICWCVFYWNRSLSRCTQSFKTIQHSWQVMDWKQKDLNWDSKRSVDKFDENISDQWIEP